MRSTLFTVGCALWCLTQMVGSAQAALVGVEIGDSGQIAYTGAAAVGSAGDQWNLLAAYGQAAPQTVSNLKLSNGASTPASFTIGAGPYQGGPVQAAGTVANTLIDNFSDSLTGNGVPAYTGTFAGLVPNTPYSLYLFGTRGGGGFGAAFSISVGTTTGGTQTTSANGFDGTFTLGRDYVAYTGATNVTSDASGVLQFTVAHDATSHTILNGAQLVGNVPEPASLGLLASGGLALLARRRPRGKCKIVTDYRPVSVQ